MTARGFAIGLLAGLVVPAIIVMAILAVYDRGTPQPALTATPTAKAAPSAVPTRTVTAKSTPKPTTTPAPTTVPSATPTATVMATPTATPSPSPTTTETPMASPTVSRYQVETREIPAGATLSASFTVPANFVLEGYFTVSGGNEQVTFWATGRGGETVVDKKKVQERAQFNLSGRQGVTYILYFENAKSPAVSKKITIYYRLGAD